MVNYHNKYSDNANGILIHIRTDATHGVNSYPGEELTGALHPVGQYTVIGKMVEVTITLRRDKQAVGKHVTVSGSTDNIPGLVAQVAALIAVAAQQADN